jgi:dTDP-4-dehydrorhamnose 3,5-epimerase
VSVQIIDFDVRPGAINGLLVLTVKQVTDERGTIREMFRRSAFEAAGAEIGELGQINVTETRLGAMRGLHAEDTTKLVGVVVGNAFGAYLDLRPESPTYCTVETVALTPGTQVLVPTGVANGFQALSDYTQYMYCFDREWRPGMSGQSCNPLDPALKIDWPIPVDVADERQLSHKDRTAPTLAELRTGLS